MCNAWAQPEGQHDTGSGSHPQMFPAGWEKGQSNFKALYSPDSQSWLVFFFKCRFLHSSPRFWFSNWEVGPERIFSYPHSVLLTAHNPGLWLEEDPWLCLPFCPNSVTMDSKRSLWNQVVGVEVLSAGRREEWGARSPAECGPGTSWLRGRLC